MSLQLVLGNCGYGKSYYIYEEIIRMSLERPDEQYLIVVPEQYTLQTQKNIVSLHPDRGVMNIDIVSFERLAYRIFDELGLDCPPVMDDAGKSMVIRKVVELKKDELEVFSGSIRKQGFIGQLKSMVSELMQYGVSEEQLKESVQFAGKKPLLQGKLKDMLTIYGGFREYIAEHYITSDEILDLLADMVERSQVLKGSFIYLDEFTGFTPIQYKILGQLLQVCQRMVISLTVDTASDPYKLGASHQLFYLTKETVFKLEKLCADIHAEREEDVQLKPSDHYRFADSPGLAFLEQNLYRHGGRISHDVPLDLSMHVCKNPDREMNYIGRKIRQLVRDEGVRYKEIAIVTGNIQKYQPVIERHFRDLKIPCFIDYKRNILMNSYVEFLRALLDMFCQDFSYESVFRYLKTGFTDISRDDVDILENYVLATGIRGANRWSKTWSKRYRGLDKDYLLVINQISQAVIEPVWELYQLFKSREHPLKECTQALTQFILGLEIKDKLQAYSQRFEEMQELSLAKEYSQIYEVVGALLEKMDQFLGDEVITVKEYMNILEAGLEEERLGIIPPSIDQVVVGDIGRTRLGNIRHLFLIGANDGVLPAVKPKIGVLTDDDKAFLAESHLELSPTSKDDACTEQFYIYSMLTKAREHLWISYSMIDSDGSAMRPSVLVNRIGNLFPEIPIIDAEEQQNADEWIVNDTNSLYYMTEQLRTENVMHNTLWKELYNWFIQADGRRPQMEHIVAAAYMIHKDNALSEAVVQAIYGNELKNSVTTLEKYAACAYAHFLNYGLKLKERQEYKLDTPDLGVIFHDALEAFSKQLAADGYDWLTVPDDVRDQLAERCVVSAAESFNNTILLDNARNQYLIQRMTRYTKRTVWALQHQLKRGKFTPADYELRFSDDELSHQLKIDLPDEKLLSLNGAIDRLDKYEDEDHVYLKVIDYKSGSKKFDIVALYHGLQLQLAVYMDAAVQMEKERNPHKKVMTAGILYYNIDDPLVSGTKLRMADEETIAADILSQLKMNGLVVNDMNVIRLLDSEFKTSSDTLPVELKKDGTLSSRSSVADNEQFAALSTFVRKKIGQLGSHILGGCIDVAPYQKGSETACDYCRYSAVCGFDYNIKGFEYRYIMDEKAADIWEKIQEEANKE